MVKVDKYIKSVNPFAGISFVNEAFNKVGLSQLIDSELGERVKYVGFSYSEILRNLTNVFLSGGDVIEDISEHLGEHLKEIPGNNVPSPDTILRGLKELSTANTVYESTAGKSYNFNINKKLNLLNIKSLILTKQLESNACYDFDYDNQITANKKHDASRTYKQNTGYFPGVATIDDKIVYIENRDGNANVKFKQAETLQNAYDLLKSQGISVNRSRMDAGSYSKEIIDVVSKNSNLFYIRANKSDTVYNQISEISDWKEVEIGYKKYEVASVKFKQFHEDKNYRLVIMREKTANTQLDIFTGDNFKYRSILTSDWESTEKEVIVYFNGRGTSEKIFDVMNNDFGWKKMPFSFLEENNSFMIVTAMIKNFYNYFVNLASQTFENIEPKTRIKRFVFRFISVAGKWVKQGREWILKLYTKKPYEQLVI
jgi:hypothetical protein